PSSQYAAEHALLRLEKGRLIQQSLIVNELDIERLRPVRCLQVPRIDHSGRAAALIHDAGSQRPAPREIGSGGEPVPVPCGEREEGSVIVSEAVAGGELERGKLLRHGATRQRRRTEQRSPERP